MKRLAVGAAMAAGFAFAGIARNAEEPLWEAGVGLAAIHFPQYRGSDQDKNYVLPVPYFVYRGDFLNADREGVRGRFVKTDRLDVDLSLGASLPVSSSENQARQGMPDLRPSIEIGPSINWTLYRSIERGARLDLRFPVRAAFTIESHPRFIGGQFFPHVNLDLRDRDRFPGWNLGLLAGPIFTDSRYNHYFYEVQPEFATPERPAYSPPGGGFAGTEFIAALSKRFPKYWVGGFVRYDTLAGARFESSPLVTSHHYFAVGLGISWILGESRQRVDVPELGSPLRG